MNESTQKKFKAEKLIALIENTDDDTERASYIKELGDLELINKKMFKSLENYLISDNSYLVRSEAAKSLFLTFEEKSEKIIINAIQNEVSGYFFEELLNVAGKSNTDFSNRITFQIFRRIGSIFELHEDDARFWWEYISECYGIPENYDVIKIEKFPGVTKSDILQARWPYIIKNNHFQGLNLYNNQLKFVPESIGYLTELRYLNLSLNKLNSLPDSMKNLVKLRVLLLSNNLIESLPKWLGTLPNLQLLILDNNPLKVVPKWLKKFTDSN